MRRKIHGILRIVEGVNVQIDFDPILLTRAHAPSPARARNTLTSVVAISITIRSKSISTSKNRTIDTCQSVPSAENSPSRRSGGGTGRHVRLRGVCRKACGFKSRPEHNFLRYRSEAICADSLTSSKQVE